MNLCRRAGIIINNLYPAFKLAERLFFYVKFVVFMLIATCNQCVGKCESETICLRVGEYFQTLQIIKIKDWLHASET